VSTSTQQVNRGVGIVGEAGAALARITAQIAEINAAASEIAASAQEQAASLNQINVAVTQMDQGVQQNAAMVEKSDIASHALARQIEQLSQLLSRFKVGDRRIAGVPPAEPLSQARRSPHRHPPRGHRMSVSPPLAF
jgi:methyl-accepting chemotaxis protein